MVNDCLAHHRPNKNNSYPPERSQKSLRLNLVPILHGVSEVGIRGSMLVKVILLTLFHLLVHCGENVETNH